MVQVIIGNKTFNTQTECGKYTKSIILELGITDSVKMKNILIFYFYYVKDIQIILTN